MIRLIVSSYVLITFSLFLALFIDNYSCSIEIARETLRQCNETYPVSRGVENYVFEYLELPPIINSTNLQCLYFCAARRLNLVDENAEPLIGNLWFTMQNDFSYSRPESIELTYICLYTLNEGNQCKRVFDFALCLARNMHEHKRKNEWMYKIPKHRFSGSG